jgi:hypothetical protein
MRELILDDVTRAQLDDMKAEVRVCGATGGTVGYLLPPDLYFQVMRAWAISPTRPEDAERAREDYRHNGGMTTAEVLEYLKGLDEPKADDP